MKARAEIIRDDECKRVQEIIYNKYLATVENNAVAAAFKRLALGSEDSVCIRIMPEKITSWDYTRMKVDGMRVSY